MSKGATVALCVNGAKIGEGRIDKTVPLLYGTDGFDIDDYGSPKSPDYAAPFLFAGTIEQVTIDLLQTCQEPLARRYSVSTTSRYEWIVSTPPTIRSLLTTSRRWSTKR